MTNSLSFRFQDSSLWSPFCLIGQDEMIDVCQVKQAMLDQLVNSTEKTILSSMQKDALNPISTSGKGRIISDVRVEVCGLIQTDSCAMYSNMTTIRNKEQGSYCITNTM